MVVVSSEAHVIILSSYHVIPLYCFHLLVESQPVKSSLPIIPTSLLLFTGLIEVTSDSE